MGQFSQVYLLDREHPTCNIEFSKLATLTFKTSFGINTLATVARVVQTFVDIFASTCLTVKLEALNELFNLFKLGRENTMEYFRIQIVLGIQVNCNRY